MKISYELAKKLYDANFPSMRFVTQRTTETNEIEVIEGPTLSELIEACGEEFAGLYHLLFLKDEQEWQALAWAKEKDGIPPEGFGKSPEEAVANLWLSLNTNRDEE